VLLIIILKKKLDLSHVSDNMLTFLLYVYLTNLVGFV